MPTDPRLRRDEPTGSDNPRDLGRVVDSVSPPRRPHPSTPSFLRLAPVLGLAFVLAGCLSTGPFSAGTPTPTGAASSAGTPGSSPSQAHPSASAPTTTRPSSPRSTATRTTTSPTTTATGCAASLTLEQQVGQLFIMGVAATGATQAQLTLLHSTRAGGVVMMGNTTAGVAGVKRYTDAMRAGANEPDGVRLMVTVDQEGGQVRRLRGPGFSAMPSAATQAGWPDATLEARAKQWGREMARAGVDVDLAPVADVVPASIGSRNKPIAAVGRGYGSDPSVVARKVTAVVRGFHTGGEGATLKHFPGLGAVIGNTDFAAKVVDSTTTRDSALLQGFDAGIAAHADMVMVSTAYYAKIDPDNPAAFSSTVIEGMLRHDRDFHGVVVSDDLGVAKAVGAWSPGERAIKFLEAGGDLITNVDPFTTDDMIDAVIAKARKDPAFAARVAQSANRVLAMKAARGLSECG